MPDEARRRVALLHNYSRASAGDGLLTELSFERLRRVGVPRRSVTLVAVDPASFADHEDVIGVGSPTRRVSLMAVRAAATSVATGLGWGLRSRLRGVDAFVGVGGGYFVGDTVVSTLGMCVNHVPQLVAAAAVQRPSAYLPISIGPFSNAAGSLVTRALSGIDLVCVRDDESVGWLVGHPNLHRIPDLAVLDIAEAGTPTRTRAASKRVAIAARLLARGGGYRARLRRLAERLPDALWVVQVEGVGSKSDRVFYRKLGFSPAGRMADVLAANGVGAVVSVRLHGALMAIRAGVPAIHLAYGAKGHAAYGDLGLLRFVHDARAFDPAAVEAQVGGFLADPSPFWEAIADRRPALLESSGLLTALLAEALEIDLGTP